MRKLFVVVAAIWWLWPSHDPRERPLQVGATANGFVARADRQIVAIDPDGEERHAIEPSLPEDFRVVGAGDGIAVGWQSEHEILVAMVTDDGALAEVSHWGHAVDHLCDGVASNGTRWGIAWAESDGSVNVVHGRVAEVAAATVAPKSWCGVASAGENIALLWRESGRTFLNFCDRQRCAGRVLTLPIERSDQLIGYGCVDAACLFAVRHAAGDTDLVRLTARGQMLVRPLPDLRGDKVSIVGIGEAFAIAYLEGEHQLVAARIAMDGARDTIVHVGTLLGMPALAWARGTLLLAFPTRDGVHYHVYAVR